MLISIFRTALLTNPTAFIITITDSSVASVPIVFGLIFGSYVKHKISFFIRSTPVVGIESQSKHAEATVNLLIFYNIITVFTINYHLS